MEDAISSERMQGLDLLREEELVAVVAMEMMEVRAHNVVLRKTSNIPCIMSKVL